MRGSTITLFALTVLVGLHGALGGGALHGQAPADTGLLTRPAQPIVIRGGWLFDGVTDTRVQNEGILVRGGKFLDVDGDLDRYEVQGALVVDLDDDETIMPGMFDLHAHHRVGIGMHDTEETRWVPMLHLANGVTSTFPAGELDPDGMVEARRRIESGEQIGARIFNSGPYFGNARNACPGVRTYQDSCASWPADMTDRQIRDRVDDWALRGVRSIKVKQASPRELRIIIDQAHRHRITVTAHLHNYAGRGTDVSVRDAILMGIDRVEHSLVDQHLILAGEIAPGTSEFEEWIRLFVDHNVYFDGTNWLYGRATIEADPTVDTGRLAQVDTERFLTPYARSLRSSQGPASGGAAQRTAQEQEWDRINGTVGYTAVFNHKAPGLLKLYEFGGGHLITTGTDTWSGFSIHNELFALAYVGLPLHAVLKAATINGASALGVSDALGTIEAGKIADLYVLRGNPLNDILATRNGRLVMKAGQLYDIATLIRAAEGRVGPTEP
ncbi:MAG: amidohydrolase family protein [Acidobacteriota bacterium]|nr:amidohydrolase family protein [Acidobacteriota bacterium]